MFQCKNRSAHKGFPIKLTLTLDENKAEITAKEVSALNDVKDLVKRVPKAGQTYKATKAWAPRENLLFANSAPYNLGQIYSVEKKVSLYFQYRK